ncbi:PRC-barrel domain-containing protein [Salipiger mucosus]|uniref:PRC-barrel domain-containing protein n=1 Tax=Salipiger mucosus DSM 16094 TaxID=1123237 RepID=S9QUL7_9RHOB|nr:PRC-barrel domain-containing protein [Salipiger mucosus]EPX85061.1 hypothetical protein Salmuc_00659 [Salipiger mucosus DSM 16094]
MLISLSDLCKSWRARAGNNRFGVTDLLFDPDRQRVTYLAVKPGGWTSTDQALAAASLMGSVDPEGREITLEITEDELARAPRWAGERSGLAEMLAGLPPLVIGPFGATHAPLALASQAAEGLGPADEETDPRAETARERYEQLSHWLGRPVFARDGEVGVVGDLLHDPDENRIAYLVVDNDRLFGRRQRAVPFAEVAHRVDDDHGGHVVLEASTTELESAPSREDLASV